MQNKSHATLFAALLSTVFLNTAEAEEIGFRGLKPSVPVKPYFEEPSFKKDQNKVLTPVLPKALKAGPTGDIEIDIKKIVIKGNTAISNSDVAHLIKPYLGRMVSMVELHQLRQNLTQYYLDRGFINSGVIIPNQKITKGTVVFQVIEGQLESFSLQGNDDLRGSYLSNRLKKGISTPLNINSLKRSLNKLQYNPLIQKVDARLSPGSQLGRAKLDVNVVESPSKAISFQVDNYRTPSVGAEAGTFAFVDNNLTGWGDSLSLSATGSDGLTSGAISYSLPVNTLDTRVHGSYQLSDTDVVEEPFDDLDISSETEMWSLGVSHPYELSNNSALTASVNFVSKTSEAFLFGEPFSFSQGAIDGESKTSVLEISADWSYRTTKQIVAASVMVRQGLKVLDATEAEEPTEEQIAADPTAFGADNPDGEFTAIVAQMQFARRLDFWDGSQIIARLATQQSLDPLLSIEKFSLGGHSSVRGYRENQLVRDNGITTTVELRLPIIRNEDTNANILQLASFVDWGEAWNEEAPETSEDKFSIYSAGVSFMWRPMPGWYLDLTWAEALEDDLATDADDLQDDGVHFSAGYVYRF